MRSRSVLARVAALLATGCAVLVGPPAGATPTGHRAFITWQGDVDALYVTDGAGGHGHRVQGTVDPWAPALSPDGRQVAYSDYAARGDVNMTLVLSPTSGRGRRVLDLGNDWITEPAWSPDGHQLVFAREHSLAPEGLGAWAYRCSIDVVDLRTLRTRTVAALAGFVGTGARAEGHTGRAGASGLCAANPSWSPRGDLIAFVADSDAYAGVDGSQAVDREALLTVHPDGTGLTTLSATASGYGVDFSPDGTHLAYGFAPRDDGSGVEELHTIGVDGTGDRVVASSGSGTAIGYPAWAPSGDRILAEVDPVTGPSYLATVELRTTSVTRATAPSPSLDYESPDWSR